jgi:hypothetical protein
MLFCLHCSTYCRLSVAELAGTDDMSIDIPTSLSVATAAATATCAAATTAATTDENSSQCSPQGSDGYVMLSTNNSATSQCGSNSDSDSDWLVVR